MPVPKPKSDLHSRNAAYTPTSLVKYQAREVARYARHALRIHLVAVLPAWRLSLRNGRLAEGSPEDRHL